MNRARALLNSRPVRTFAQATAAAMLVDLSDGGAWSDLPQAASIGAFAGLISLLMLVAGPKP